MNKIPITFAKSPVISPTVNGVVQSPLEVSHHQVFFG